MQRERGKGERGKEGGRGGSGKREEREGIEREGERGWELKGRR